MFENPSKGSKSRPRSRKQSNSIERKSTDFGRTFGSSVGVLTQTNRSIKLPPQQQVKKEELQIPEDPDALFVSFLKGI